MAADDYSTPARFLGAIGEILPWDFELDGVEQLVDADHLGFHRPLVCLLAPCPPPDAPRKAKAQLASLTQLAGGGALSLFLHDPIGAFCALGGVKVTSTSTHDKCLKLLLAAFSELTKLLVESADTPPDILAFLQVERPAN